MESQLQRPHGHTYDDPQNASAVHSMVEDEGEHHHEKQSVLTKVKAKAKKIKDTLKKHGYGHEPEREHDYHHEGRDEDEDEDEETVEDPEIHGAPVYKSATIKSAVPSQGINLEEPTAIGEDRYGTKSTDQVEAWPAVQGQRQYYGQSETNPEKPMATEVAHAPEDKNVSFAPDVHGTRPKFSDENVEKVQKQGARIGELEHLKDGPSYAGPETILASNYETKVTHPTGKGGEEAQMTPLIQSLDKMSVSDESVPKPERKLEQGGYTGSHDQFAPRPIPTADEFAPKPFTTSSGQGSSASIPKSYDPSKPEELPRDTLTGKSPDQSGYIEKISTATSATESIPSKPEELPRDTLTGKSPDQSGYIEKTSTATSATESMPKSYDPSKPEELPRDTLTGKSPDQSGYIEKISTATSATESIPKSYDPSKPEELPRDTLTGKSPDQSGYIEKISTATSATESIPKSYDPSKPEELPRDTSTGKSPDQSGYIEKISTATSALTDKAISAKNVVASKLGYGGTEGAKGQEMGEGKEGVKSTSPTEYAQKVAATVTQKLAPVYGKVTGAGSSVISKVKASRTNAGKDERPELRNEGEDKVADKGVSVKEYLTEKFKPSDEHKALSEVISETLHKKKEEVGKTEESKPMGKVTESEEVARRLGSGTEQHREGDDAIAAVSESTGKGVVGRIKDAVNLCVAKGGQDHHSEGSPASLGSKGSSATGEVEERRLQESVN